MDKIDLTVSHDVLGEYHKLDFSDIKRSIATLEHSMRLKF